MQYVLLSSDSPAKPSQLSKPILKIFPINYRSRLIRLMFFAEDACVGTCASSLYCHLFYPARQSIAQSVAKYIGMGRCPDNARTSWRAHLLRHGFRAWLRSLALPPSIALSEIALAVVLRGFSHSPARSMSAAERVHRVPQRRGFQAIATRTHISPIK